jgi:hypothetical protein
VVAIGALLYHHGFFTKHGAILSVREGGRKPIEISIAAVCTLGDGLFDHNPLALVWALFVGAFASEDTSPDGMWFRRCLERACEADSQRLRSIYIH